MSKKYFYYHKWENEAGKCHTTVVTDQPPKEFLDSLLGNWIEIRQFSSEEELRKFGKTVGLTRSERRIGVWVLVFSENGEPYFGYYIDKR